MDVQVRFAMRDTIELAEELMSRYPLATGMEELSAEDRREAAFLYRKAHELLTITGRQEAHHQVEPELARLDGFFLWYFSLHPFESNDNT